MALVLAGVVVDRDAVVAAVGPLIKAHGDACVTPFSPTRPPKSLPPMFTHSPSAPVPSPQYIRKPTVNASVAFRLGMSANAVPCWAFATCVCNGDISRLARWRARQIEKHRYLTSWIVSPVMMVDPLVMNLPVSTGEEPSSSCGMIAGAGGGGGGGGAGGLAQSVRNCVRSPFVVRSTAMY